MATQVIPVGVTDPNRAITVSNPDLYVKSGNYQLFTAPTQPVAADTMNSGQDLINVPKTTPDVSSANTTVSGAQSGSKSIQDYIAQLTPPTTPEQQQYTDITNRVNELLGQTQGQTQALATEEANRGVPSLQGQLTGINSSLQTRLAEYQNAQRDYDTALATLQSDASPFRGQGRGIPLALVRGQEAKTMAQKQYDKAIDLNSRASEISLLQAQSLGLQGQIEAAQTAAQKAVELKYAPIEEELKIKQAQLQLLQPILDKQEKIVAAALARQYEDQQRSIAEAKEKSRTNVTEALSQGITTRYVNRNGKFYRTMDGYEFNSEQEFFQDAGVSSFPQAYQRGLVTDLNGQIMSDRNLVAQIRAKYWDAGIGLTDSLDVAKQKAQRSQIFQNELAKSGEAGKFVTVNGQTYWADEQGNLSTPQVPVEQTPQATEKANNLVQIIDNLLKDPGLSNAVGPISSKLPALTGKRTDFENRFKNLQALMTLENLSLLKGPMSDKDIQFLKESSSALNLNMSEQGFKNELQKIRDKLTSVQSSQQTMQRPANVPADYIPVRQKTTGATGWISPGEFDSNTYERLPFSGGSSGTPRATGARTDRHNNPTAFTTDVARVAGLVEGVDYTRGDAFPASEGGSRYYTAKLLGDPIATTIKVIDRIGFYTQGGRQRWTHTAIPQSQWNNMSYAQKVAVVKRMYQNEGGSALKSLFSNYG